MRIISIAPVTLESGRVVESGLAVFIKLDTIEAKCGLFNYTISVYVNETIMAAVHPTDIEKSKARPKIALYSQESPIFPNESDTKNLKINGLHAENYLEQHEIDKIFENGEENVNTSLYHRLVYRDILAKIRKIAGYWSFYSQVFEIYYENDPIVAIPAGGYVIDRIWLKNNNTEEKTVTALIPDNENLPITVAAGAELDLPLNYVYTNECTMQLTDVDGFEYKVMLKVIDQVPKPDEVYE